LQPQSLARRTQHTQCQLRHRAGQTAGLSGFAGIDRRTEGRRRPAEGRGQRCRRHRRSVEYGGMRALWRCGERRRRATASRPAKAVTADGETSGCQDIQWCSTATPTSVIPAMRLPFLCTTQPQVVLWLPDGLIVWPTLLSAFYSLLELVTQGASAPSCAAAVTQNGSCTVLEARSPSSLTSVLVLPPPPYSPLTRYSSALCCGPAVNFGPGIPGLARQ